MTPPVFLVGPGGLTAERVLLTGPEGHHASVHRLGVGERVDLCDGVGAVAQCTVLRVGRDQLELTVTARWQQPAPRPWLVVVQAVPKGDRGALAVELLTEVGVDEVVPWAAQRGVVRWHGERGQRALSRWRASARQATKQSRRAWLPLVGELADTATVCRRLAAAALPVLLHETAGVPLAGRGVPPADGEIVVVVGPEGGLAGAELAAFTAAGATAYRLGPTVLRTSTAGAAAASLLLASCGRWS